MRFSLVPATLLLSATLTTAGGFARTCTDIQYYGDSILQALCLDNVNGEARRSEIDINRCVGNSKSTLKCMRNGDFSQSCQTTTIQGETGLVSVCRNGGDGNWRQTYIDLNRCITNTHGQLTC